MSKETCLTCQYWQRPRNSFTGEPGGASIAASGTCRRRAPSTGFWPMTYDFDWCGEHVSAPAPALPPANMHPALHGPMLNPPGTNWPEGGSAK